MDQFKPTTYVNIEEYCLEKLKAWHCYKGENRAFPFPRSDEGLEALANTVVCRLVCRKLRVLAYCASIFNLFLRHEK